MERWRGRVAVVSGAGSGIGAAVTRLLALNGMRVVAVDIQLEQAQAIAKEATGEVHAQQGDVTKDDDVTRVVKWCREQLGGADVLVNCAGLYRKCLLHESATSEMRALLETNVIGLSIFTREVLKDMRERGVQDGHIVHICSIVGQRIIQGKPGTGSYMYSASKHAVRVLTEGLRREIQDLGMRTRITSISPGMVFSNLYTAIGATGAAKDKFYEERAHLQPEDIAQSILHAISAPPHVQIHEITLQAVGDKL